MKCKYKKSKKTPIVKALVTDLEHRLRECFSEVWDDATNELKENVYACFDCLDLKNGTAYIAIAEDCSGEELWTGKLSDLVAEFIKVHDGGSRDSGERKLRSDWCDAVATDMETQVLRLRKHAIKLRSEPGKK